MRQLSSLLNGLAKSLYAGKRKVPGAEEGREAADELRREAKKNDTILRSSGSTRSCVSVFSQRGEKGVNQDCYIVWEEALALASVVAENKPCHFDVWKQSYIKSCAAVDKELEHDHGLDSFSLFAFQGELMVIANIGDSRAVLATTSDDGSLVPIQLTIDFKPNLPRKFRVLHVSTMRIL
ncbi:hypothetical protein BHM03_00005596 [Ensete ventricosum]|uniref:protein-serine/threonine phosphatase n=1 Tax=Ensete ventricosum TaxID=4639 RepID=A0A445MBG0_ENSVE|nr:hypothetical protein BHM03_00005596 [Ensete ventricosum]